LFNPHYGHEKPQALGACGFFHAGRASAMPRLPRFAALSALSAVALAAADYPFQPVPFTAVRVTGGFWQQKQEVNRAVTVPFALQQCEESGRLKNFDLAAEVMRRRAAGEKDFSIKPPTIYPFDDTDAYKRSKAPPTC
jgi:hypothetical protein